MVVAEGLLGPRWPEGERGRELDPFEDTVESLLPLTVLLGMRLGVQESSATRKIVNIDSIHLVFLLLLPVLSSDCEDPYLLEGLLPGREGGLELGLEAGLLEGLLDGRLPPGVKGLL